MSRLEIKPEITGGEIRVEDSDVTPEGGESLARSCQEIVTGKKRGKNFQD